MNFDGTFLESLGTQARFQVVRDCGRARVAQESVFGARGGANTLSGSIRKPCRKATSRPKRDPALGTDSGHGISRGSWHREREVLVWLAMKCYCSNS